MAEQIAIPCLFMRAGTSRGPFFNRNHLPQDLNQLSKVLVAAVGAGHKLNINGIGGGVAVTTKVAMVSPSNDEWADVDYFFAQVNVEDEQVDYSPTCGNMLSGIGPAAIEMGLVSPSEGQTSIKILSMNTGARIEAIVETPADPVLSETTLIDVAVPMMMVRASDMEKTGYEPAQELTDDIPFMNKLEAMRVKAGELMGLGDVTKRVVPKVGLLSAPRNQGSLNIRYFMPWQCHPSLAVTGSMAFAGCVLQPGTVADSLTSVVDHAESLVFEHPMGDMEVTVDYSIENDQLHLRTSGSMRTARLLMRGELLVPSTTLQ